MNVEVEETGQVERKLRIEIPTADVDATFEQVYRTMAKGARIPGFRRGKAPRSVMERYFGDQARSAAVADTYRDQAKALYGDARGRHIKYAEAFELCEYGRQPTLEQLKELFPFFDR